MSHTKTFDRTYWCKAENKNFVEDPSGHIKTTEYVTENGIKGRYLIIENRNSFEKNMSTLLFKHQVLEEGEWITSGIVDSSTADYFSYCDNAGLTVTEAEATELVDDLDREILDYTDPQNPVSFDPKQYEQKKVTKAGYHLKFDYYMDTFSPGLMPTFEQILLLKFDITV